MLQDVLLKQGQALKQGLAHLTSNIRDIEVKGSKWTHKEARALKQGLAHLNNNIIDIESAVEKGFGKGSEWISKEFKSLAKNTPHIIKENEEYAEKELNKLKHDVHSAEEWFETELHKSGEATSDTLESLKHRINNLNKSIHHLENSGSKIISDEAKSIGHGLHEVGEDLSILEDKIMRKIIDLLKSYPEGLTIAGIIKKLNLARHTVLARLNTLVGKGFVKIRKINMAKLHFWNAHIKEHEHDIKVVPLAESHISVNENTAEREEPIDIEKLKAEIRGEIEHELVEGKIEKEEAQIEEQRRPIKKIIGSTKDAGKEFGKERIKTGIEGLDDLISEGIPKGANIIVAGGPGSGKTILCLQILAYHASRGKKCLYMSFDDSESRLEQNMKDFGWNPGKLEKSKNLRIQKFNPFDITRSVDALMMKAKGELLIDLDPILLPENYKPDFIVVDSLTAISSAFTESDANRRPYIEQLFKLFDRIGATSFLITETSHIPTAFSTIGAEEFLADGIIALYNVKKGNARQKALEVIKLKGVRHEEKIVSFDISNKGIKVNPKKKVFGKIEEHGSY